MDVYLVGGAVRDELLGREVKERDWVVVGGSPERMLADGYRQVGKDFPVFLHPETGEEYALARTERKTGPGHTGFAVHADTSVTLEEDLQRRDLTVNAMARAADGVLVDPYGGRSDLEAATLRHVSPAFEEDPLRVFRVARFAAQLPGFEVAVETGMLMRTMAGKGALAELSAERVWGELRKTLSGVAPEKFIAVLRDCEALDPWFSEFRTVDPVVRNDLPGEPQRFAAFTSSLNEAGLDALASRLKTPRQHHRLARWVIRHSATAAHWQTEDVRVLYAALEDCRAFRTEGDLSQALAVVESLHGIDLQPLVRVVEEISKSVRAADFQAQGLSGHALGEALVEARIRALDQARR